MEQGQNKEHIYLHENHWLTPFIKHSASVWYRINLEDYNSAMANFQCDSEENAEWG